MEPDKRALSTVLVIEDSAAHRAEIRSVLETCGLFDRILEAEEGFQGLRLLLGEPVDVVLCDLEMPGLDGEKLLHANASRAGGPDVPFLFLTASTNPDRKVKLLETGACDTIAKPFHPADLVARLRLHLKVKKLQDELMEKNAQLARLSTTDALTGLRSRRYASEVLAIEFLRARRYGLPLTLLMADVDHFKAVNDRHGHVSGDAVLRGIADRLSAILRATDVAGRYGGEEFIVILVNNAPDGGAVLAERWREAVESAPFETHQGQRIAVTISVGVAGFDARHETPEDLVGAADTALYRAKAAGRNRVVIAAPADVEPAAPKRR